MEFASSLAIEVPFLSDKLLVVVAFDELETLGIEVCAGAVSEGPQAISRRDLVEEISATIVVDKTRNLIGKNQQRHDRWLPSACPNPFFVNSVPAPRNGSAGAAMARSTSSS